MSYKKEEKMTNQRQIMDFTAQTVPDSPPKLDDLSVRLIALLQEDGRASFREMGKRLGLSPGTVRARFNQLREAGIVEVIAIPNAWRMGLRFHATVGLRLEPGRTEEVADILAKRREIAWIGLLLTGYDLLIEIALRDAQEFGHYRETVLAKLPGFIGADVFVTWDIRKFRYSFTSETDSDESRMNDPAKGEGAPLRRTGRARKAKT